MNKNLVVALYSAAYAMMFITWTVLVCLGIKGAETLIGFIQAGLVALTSHIFTYINSGDKQT